MHPLQLLVKRGWRGVGKKAYLGPASEGSNKFTQKRPGQAGGGRSVGYPPAPGGLSHLAVHVRISFSLTSFRRHLLTPP